MGKSRESPKPLGRGLRREEDAGREEVGQSRGRVHRLWGGEGGWAGSREEMKGNGNREKLENKTRDAVPSWPLRASDSGRKSSIRHNFVKFQNSWDKQGLVPVQQGSGHHQEVVGGHRN